MDFNNKRPYEMGVHEFDPNDEGRSWTAGMIIGIVVGVSLVVLSLVL
jgi:hypothetical protein